MGWVLITVIGAAILLIADWFIVMGFDPKKWKGGGGNEDNQR